MSKDMSVDDWRRLASSLSQHNSDKRVYEYKILSYISLFKRWKIDFSNTRVLVTDLFDEAFYRNNLCNYFIQQGADVTGSDISNNIARRAARHTKGKILCRDSSFNYPEKVFDIIFSPSTFDHSNPRLLLESVNNLCKSLSNTGFIILSVHNAFNIHWHLLSLIDSKDIHYEKFNHSKIKRLFSDSNLEVVKMGSLMHFPTIYLAPKICDLFNIGPRFLIKFESISEVPFLCKFGLLNIYLLRKV